MAYYNAFNEQLPIGCRFNPTPQELITWYLLSKVRNQMQELYSFIKDCDVYNEEHVWMKECDEYNRFYLRNTRYYFTNLKLKTVKGKRKARETTTGVWKSEKDSNITEGKNKVHIGSVRSFSYQPKKENANMEWIKERSWTMKEYRLDGQYKNVAGSSSLVLCEVKETKKIKKNDEEEQQHKINISTTSYSTHVVVDEAAAIAAVPVNTKPPQEENDDEYMEHLLTSFDDVDDGFMEGFDQFINNLGK